MERRIAISIKVCPLKTSEYRLTRFYRDEKPVIELYDHTRNSLENKKIAEEQPEVVQRLLPILEKGNRNLYPTK